MPPMRRNRSHFSKSGKDCGAIGHDATHSTPVWRYRNLMSLGESNPATLIFESALILAMSLMVATAHGQSASDCAAQAERAARGSTSVIGGAAAGAAGGAAIGAIARKDSRKGAKRGAAIGAVAGGATQAYRKNDRYKRVYDDCMAGYRVEHY